MKGILERSLGGLLDKHFGLCIAYSTLIAHTDAEKVFWYNPYTMKKVFKNPHASKFHFPGLRHTDVLQQKFDQEGAGEDSYRVRYTRTYDGQMVIHRTDENHK